MVYLRNKWSDWNVHGFERNELNKDRRTKPLEILKTSSDMERMLQE